MCLRSNWARGEGLGPPNGHKRPWALDRPSRSLFPKAARAQLLPDGPDGDSAPKGTPGEDRGHGTSKARVYGRHTGKSMRQPGWARSAIIRKVVAGPTTEMEQSTRGTDCRPKREKKPADTTEQRGFIPAIVIPDTVPRCPRIFNCACALSRWSCHQLLPSYRTSATGLQIQALTPFNCVKFHIYIYIYIYICTDKINEKCLTFDMHDNIASCTVINL